MKDLLTVREAAKLLSLNPQTVYRMCRRGELASLRLGRTIRLRRESLFERSLKNPAPAAAAGRESVGASALPLPEFLHRLFWDVDAAALHAHDRLVIERVLENGDLPDVRWLRRTVPPERLRCFVERYGRRRLSARSHLFWRRILEVTNGSDDAPAESAAALGETGWR